MLPSWIKEYLSFHKKERRGILVLLVIILLLSGFNIYQRVFWKGDWDESIFLYGPQLVAFDQRIDSTRNAAADKTPWIPSSREFFKFDPNTLDSTGWTRLGFSAKQAASILRYREAGAIFRKAEDIKKLYVVDDELYNELRPFIVIGPIPVAEKAKNFEKSEYEEKPKWEKPEYVAKSVELNTADSATLVGVRGIGPFFARVIVEYRDKLGGFRSKSQVLEVYGMDSAKFSKMESELWVDSSAITKININRATLKELLRHPYINFNQAKAIVNYREQHGLYKSISDLEKVHLLKGEPYTKVAPYISLD